jgi:two-component system chemotaxis response regulator CheY
MRKIILVDDKVVYRNAIKALLQKIGNVEIVAEASNGNEFLNLLTEYQPDIVFMDVEMPDLNGIEATHKALEKYKDLIIIGLSMYDNPVYIEDLVKAGAKGYLLKLSDNIQIFKEIIINPSKKIFYSKEIERRKYKDVDSRFTIMIVEDFENTRYVIEFTLQQADYEVIKAVDGLDAIRHFNGQKIDLLVTDLHMPRMNGFELIENVKKIEQYKNIPVLMLTTEIDKEKKIYAKNLGITGWIQKPFVMERFLNIVKKALR